MNNIFNLSDSFKAPPSVDELEVHIQKIIDSKIEYDTLSPDWKINIVGGHDKINHIIKSSRYGKLNKPKLSRHKKYIANIEELIKNSKYTNNPSLNTKLNKKPKVARYHYFETFVNVKGKVYKVILNAEEYIGESTHKPQTVHLYDVIEVKN